MKIKGIVLLLANLGLGFGLSIGCGGPQEDLQLEKFKAKIAEKNAKRSVIKGTVDTLPSSSTETIEPDLSKAILTDSFNIKIETSDVVDLTVGSIQDVFLTSMDSEIKKGGPSVWYEPQPVNNGDMAVAGQLDIVLPLSKEEKLNLTMIGGRKTPAWVNKCEILVMYHLECDGNNEKSLGLITKKEGSETGQIRFNKNNDLIVDYICPGFYQAAYNCGSQKIAEDKSFKAKVSPKKILKSTRTKGSPGENPVDTQTIENPYINIAEIQDSEVGQGDSLIEKAFKYARNLMEKKIESSTLIAKENQVKAEALTRAAEESKEHVKKIETQESSLKEKIKSIVQNGKLSDEDKEAAKKLIAAKIKNLLEEKETLKSKIELNQNEAKEKVSIAEKFIKFVKKTEKLIVKDPVESQSEIEEKNQTAESTPTRSRSEKIDAFKEKLKAIKDRANSLRGKAKSGDNDENEQESDS